MQVVVLARQDPGDQAELARLRSEERLDDAMREECVQSWLGMLGLDRRRQCSYGFRDWLRWLWRQPGYAGVMPSEMLDFQDSATGRAKHELQRLMKQWAQSGGGTYGWIFNKFTMVRSFFAKNEVALPPIGGWEPQPTREPVEGRLNFLQVVEIVKHANPRDTAIFLTMLQGVMDEARFCKFNVTYAERLVERIKTGRFEEPFRIDFLSGRKRNRRKFHTYIYHDALEAWRNYFEKVCNKKYPQPGQPIALTKEGRPVSRQSIRDSFDTIARRLHYKPKPGANKYARSGVGPHEAFRDVVKSHMQTATAKGFDMTCINFWMGHRIDPYNYNKFTELETDYVLKNAKIASQYLNILSNPVIQKPGDLWATLKLAAKEDPKGLQEFLEFTKGLEPSSR